jgi:Domain of unknown function (DUF4337)
MDASDVADHIREAVEAERAERREDERFRTRAAILVGVLAMLLAIASLGGENATKELINANIHASDTWAFYQAKTIRQTVNEIAANELEAALVLHRASLAEDIVPQLQQRIDRYRATIARYESEPDPSDQTNPLKGEGKQELMARARAWEAKRQHAQAQDPNFDYAVALFQIAIVLGSVAIVAGSRRIFALSLVMGVVATLLMLNGFLLFLALPVG